MATTLSPLTENENLLWGYKQRYMPGFATQSGSSRRLQRAAEMVESRPCVAVSGKRPAP
jgi:hypothetical protein